MSYLMKYHYPNVTHDPQDDPDCEADEYERSLGLHEDDGHEAQVESEFEARFGDLFS